MGGVCFLAEFPLGGIVVTFELSVGLHHTLVLGLERSVCLQLIPECLDLAGVTFNRTIQCILRVQMGTLRIM